MIRWVLIGKIAGSCGATWRAIPERMLDVYLEVFATVSALYRFVGVCSAGPAAIHRAKAAILSEARLDCEVLAAHFADQINLSFRLCHSKNIIPYGRRCGKHRDKSTSSRTDTITENDHC